MVNFIVAKDRIGMVLNPNSGQSIETYVIVLKQAL